VTPDKAYVFVDRYGTVLPTPVLRVKLEDIQRDVVPSPPKLSLLFLRWGGSHRLGADATQEEVECENGWGCFGSPPSDWYMDALVKLGVDAHPALGRPHRQAEVLSVFFESDAYVQAFCKEADQIASLLHGDKKASFWMLWPADFPTDWRGADYIAYVERREIFACQRALEAARVRSVFPHPASLWEFITGKAWMATLAPHSHTMRLPACTLVSRAAIESDLMTAAMGAVKQIEELRRTSVFAATGGPAVANGGGLTQGVVKIGWSWEAKFVWFWRSHQELAQCLKEMIRLPGCSAEYCIVQEWVDFDFELRLFFFPPRDFKAGMCLEPVHFEYTAWEQKPNADVPGTFLKPKRESIEKWWQGDTEALKSAHQQAIEASRHLIAELLQHHAEPVPMIRMDWMLKRRSPGVAQVVFGEYCEMGACCLKWEDGPPRIWRQALDYALQDTRV